MKRSVFSFIIVLLSFVFYPSVSALNETDGFFCTDTTVTDDSRFYSEIFFSGDIRVRYMEFILTLPEGISLCSYASEDSCELIPEDGKYRFLLSEPDGVSFADGKRLIKLIMIADEGVADGSYIIKAENIRVIDTDDDVYSPGFTGGLIKVSRTAVTEEAKSCEHRFEGWKVISEPDYDRTGKRVKICTVCNKVCKILEIPAVPRYSISLTDVSYRKTCTYTGKALKPQVSMRYKGIPLEKDKDFTLTYRNNKSVGTGTVIVKGIGGFEGEIILNFSIKPKTSSVTGISRLKNGKVKIRWKKIPECDGYRIYVRYPGRKKYRLLKTVNNPKLTYYTTGKLKSGGKYRFKIRTYVSDKGNRIFSSYSKIKVFRL